MTGYRPLGNWALVLTNKRFGPLLTGKKTRSTTRQGFMTDFYAFIQQDVIYDCHRKTQFVDQSVNVVETFENSLSSIGLPPSSLRLLCSGCTRV